MKANNVQGHQLTHDLNYIVCMEKQWRLPVYWAPLLRYFAAPVLSIIFSFAYPNFYVVRGDPLEIFGFFVSHLVLFIILLTFIYPRTMDVFVPKERRPEGVRHYAPQVVVGLDDPNLVSGVGTGDVEEGGMEVKEDKPKP